MIRFFIVVVVVVLFIAILGTWFSEYYRRNIKEQFSAWRLNRLEARQAREEARAQAQAERETKEQANLELQPSSFGKLLDWSQLAHQLECFHLYYGDQDVVFPGDFDYRQAAIIEHSLRNARPRLDDLTERIQQLAKTNQTDIFNRAAELAHTTDAQIRRDLQSIFNICIANGAMTERREVIYSQDDIDRIQGYRQDIQDHLDALEQLVDNLVEYLHRHDGRQSPLDQLLAYNAVFERELQQADGDLLRVLDNQSGS